MLMIIYDNDNMIIYDNDDKCNDDYENSIHHREIIAFD